MTVISTSRKRYHEIKLYQLVKLNTAILRHFVKNDDRTFIFSHPDYTVGFGVTPNPAHLKSGSRAREACLQRPPS